MLLDFGNDRTLFYMEHNASLVGAVSGTSGHASVSF
eukprot:SAG11_NODE_2655_length_3123_cov_1.476852_1_plen_35_part_10